MNVKLKFYDVSKEYISFLQSCENKKRGFSRVPNMTYENREQKFLCGIVLGIKGLDYYVPVTSYKIKQSENILIKFSNESNNPIGSIRFNYMFPIPKEMVSVRIIENEPRLNRRVFLSKQINFLNTIRDKVYRHAKTTYNKITKELSPNLNYNSCDFLFLEEKCLEYCKLHNLTQSLEAFKSKNGNKEPIKNELM